MAQAIIQALLGFCDFLGNLAGGSYPV